MGSVCHKHPFFPICWPVWPCFSRFWAKNHPKMVRFRAKLTFYTIRRTKTGFLRPYGPENGKTVFFCPYYCIWDQLGPVSRLIWTPLDLFFPFSYPFDLVFSRFWAEYHPKMVRFRAKLTFYTIRRKKTGFLRPYGPENGKTGFLCPYYCIWDQFHLYHFLIWGKNGKK